MEFRRLKQTLTDLLKSANEDAVVELDSGVAGPAFAITALTHGDEISGLVTIARLHDAIVNETLTMTSGRLYLLLANYEILLNANGFDELSRHRGVDLNRVWGEDDPVIREGNLGAGELSVRERLLPWVCKADHLVDLHSTGQPSTPMGILVSNAPAICDRVIDVLDVDWVFQNIHEYLNGISLIQRHQLECLRRNPDAETLSLVIEAGQHFDLTTIDRNLDNVIQLMGATGICTRPPLQRANPPGALDVYHVGLAQSAGDIINWHYSSNPGSFDRVEHGVKICTLHDESIMADGDTLIVMPRVQALAAGDEMFYLAHEQRRD